MLIHIHLIKWYCLPVCICWHAHHMVQWIHRDSILGLYAERIWGNMRAVRSIMTMTVYGADLTIKAIPKLENT